MIRVLIHDLGEPRFVPTAVAGIKELSRKHHESICYDIATCSNVCAEMYSSSGMASNIWVYNEEDGYALEPGERDRYAMVLSINPTPERAADFSAKDKVKRERQAEILLSNTDEINIRENSFDASMVILSEIREMAQFVLGTDYKGEPAVSSVKPFANVKPSDKNRVKKLLRIIKDKYEDKPVGDKYYSVIYTSDSPEDNEFYELVADACGFYPILISESGKVWNNDITLSVGEQTALLANPGCARFIGVTWQAVLAAAVNVPSILQYVSSQEEEMWYGLRFNNCFIWNSSVKNIEESIPHVRSVYKYHVKSTEGWDAVLSSR